ncbi:lymphocyte antigen 6A-2/6E-1-like [Dasypus novemcinctus]|uniref:lymphocyte antigen 6A-2/6E-1-like n=1 Tax=Dasypus novemcinctus TaxID=9361 RepID=UPI00032890AE|nr:lymphocyte antigen 6A-2/6E-1-like [Dasypus novemcinctus]
MKVSALVPLVVLLVALLCAERGQGLRCHQCYTNPDLSPCTPDTCSLPDDAGGFCASQLVSTTVGTAEVQVEHKFCLSACPQEFRDLSQERMGRVLKSRVTCCQEDLCNAARRAGGSARALLGGLLLSLGLALLGAPWG